MKKGGKRFANRPLEFFDIIQRFEEKSCSDHVRTAQAAIERLRQEGDGLWTEDQPQRRRWREYCNVLRQIVVSELSNRRFVQKQDLTKVLREFFGEFEHSTHGMYEMMYGTTDCAESDPRVRGILSWFELVYRSSTYAITSFWLDEKHEEKTTTLQLKFEPGGVPHFEVEETVVHKAMKKPKDPKHRRATKKL